MSTWLTHAPPWTEDCLKILTESEERAIKNVSLEDVLTSSDDFPIEFPIDSIRMKTLLATVPKNVLERNIQSSYPIMHESILFLCTKFILMKRLHGTTKEKDLYRNMTLLQFIQRLLVKRAVMFICKNDQYVLRDDTQGAGLWEHIGTDSERDPLILEEYLSYDEIKISAFLSVSSYSYFINNGDRFNDGIPIENREKIEEEGVIIGLVGTRLEKRNVMEFQEILITKSQNTALNGYGDSERTVPNIHNLFSEFYNEETLLYDNVRYGPVKNMARFKELNNGDIFDNVVYEKRLSVSFDILLLEANQRAKEIGKSAYIHVVGIGLGVWRMSIHQEDIFVEAFAKRLSVLGPQLGYISDIHLAYFLRTLSCAGWNDGEMMPVPGHPHGGIRIHISERDPFTKLSATGKLLVVSYAWDGNALPGNEFWKGMLGNSGDSATAASCQIAELHNPFINKTVCAGNLRVVTVSHGVVPIQKYVNLIINSANDENVK